MFPVISNLVPNIILWLLLLSLVFLLWVTKGKRRARIWGIIFFIIIWALGTRPVAEGILSPLESRYSVPTIEDLRKGEVKAVVVLTGGGYPDHGELLSSALPHASIYRFLGGSELCARMGRDCRLIFSGSAGRNDRDNPIADRMKNLSLQLNPARRVSAESISASTSEHPGNVKSLIGKRPFVLVTSAYHMPRSMRTFRKAGLNPIPYPVDFLSQGDYHWNDWFPSAESLWEIQVAVREYFALLFYKVKGYI